MNTKITQLIFAAVTTLLILSNVGCGKSSSSNSAPSAAGLGAISMASTPTSVAPGATVFLTPTGGTAPYTFILTNSIGGSLSSPSGLSSIYTAPTAGGQSQTIQIADSAGNSAFFSIAVTGTGSGVLTVTPLNGSVIINGALTFSATGGTAPYTYTVISGGGSFSGNVYYAPSTAQTVTVNIQDSAGNSTQTSIFVSTTGTGTGVVTCQGSFRLGLSGSVWGTLTITQSSTGSISGTLGLDGQGASAISGMCYISGNTAVITFTNLYSLSQYVGQVSYNTSNGKLYMSGTYTDINQYVWTWTASQ